MTGPHPLLVSVIIPTFNRPARLAECLDALAAQSLSTEQFEVIVVDDGSAASIAHELVVLVERLSSRLQIRLLRQDNGGPAMARNTGAAAARTELLAFTDDDCRPDSEWLERLVEAHAGATHALLGGPLTNALPGNVCARSTHAIMNYAYREQEEKQTLRLFSTSNLAVPASLFTKVFGFDERFPRAAGEDYDLCARWHDEGFDARFVATAMVRHAHVLTLRSFVRQHFNYGGGLRLLRVRARERGKSAWHALGRARPVSYYLRMLMFPLQSDGVRGIPVLLLVVLSQLATFAGALLMTRDSRLRVSASSSSGAQVGG